MSDELLLKVIKIISECDVTRDADDACAFGAVEIIQLVKDNQPLDLLLAKSERDDVKRTAARLANALTDINNNLGELPEVKKAFASVEYDVSNYAGLEEIGK